MKNRVVYFLTMLTIFLACSDDFTEKPAKGSLNDQNLQNEEGVDLLLIGAYSTLDGVRNNLTGNEFSYGGDNWWMDVLADDAHKGSTDGDQIELFNLEVYNWTSDNPYILGRWEALFAGVNRSNAVMATILGIEEIDLNKKMAEARFLRGHFNFELQRMYGNVPFISEENYANTEFNQPNPGPIWDQIESDFDFAIKNLPAMQEDVGRPTSWAAKAYLGKVHLQQSEWSEALSLLREVIDNGPYALNDEFATNFRLLGDNSKESIFSIQFTADNGLSYNGNTGGTLNFPVPGPFGSCCGFYQPTQDLVNAFQTDASGLPLLDTFNDTDVKNNYGIDDSESFTPYTGPLDPRLDYTVGRRGIDYNGYGPMPGSSWIEASSADISGPYLPKKNIYYAGEESNMGTGDWGQQSSGINYHILRYADVLLMAAEAAAELGDLDLALDYVNQVRVRAKNMTYVQNESGTGNAANYQIEPYPNFPDQIYAKKAVRMERRLELAMEGHRLFDIRRWGNGIDIMNDYFMNEARTIPNFGNKVGTYESKHDLLPIPLTAIDLSGGVLKQNPGF